MGTSTSDQLVTDAEVSLDFVVQMIVPVVATGFIQGNGERLRVVQNAFGDAVIGHVIVVGTKGDFARYGIVVRDYEAITPLTRHILC